MQIGHCRDHPAGMAQIGSACLARKLGPCPSGAWQQGIRGGIVDIVGGYPPGAGGDLDRPGQKVRAEGRMMSPHDLDRRGSRHQQTLADDQKVAVDAELAPHGHRHTEEVSAEHSRTANHLHIPGRYRGLAMEAVESAVEGAGIAAIGKQQRPAAAIAREPMVLVARAKAGYRRVDGIPGHLAQHRQA